MNTENLSKEELQKAIEDVQNVLEAIYEDGSMNRYRSFFEQLYEWRCSATRLAVLEREYRNIEKLYAKSQAVCLELEQLRKRVNDDKILIESLKKQALKVAELQTQLDAAQQKVASYEDAEHKAELQRQAEAKRQQEEAERLKREAEEQRQREEEERRKREEEARLSLSQEELRQQLREQKKKQRIDAQFKKDLQKRGF